MGKNVKKAVRVVGFRRENIWPTGTRITTKLVASGSMKIAWGRTFLYVTTSLIVTALWTIRARTEHQDNDFSSITALANGTVRRPFVKRRLLADAARGIAWAVPRRVWELASARIDSRDDLSQFIRDDLGWKRSHDPVLISATILIALSVVGFMLAMRALILSIYVTPSWFADLCALALGWSLLGGGGDIRFGFYPYDLPQASLCALTLAAIVVRGRVLLPIFALAAYSKETSALLIPAYILIHGRCPWRCWLPTAAALLCTFLVVRGFLDYSYGSGAGGFWFPGRNARWIAWTWAFDAWWYYPFWIVSVVRLALLWPRFPAPLRRIAVLILVLPGLAFFKGWIEEKRQYLEMLPILGPLLIQWVVTELGFGSLMSAREFK